MIESCDITKQLKNATDVRNPIGYRIFSKLIERWRLGSTAIAIRMHETNLESS